jgi:DNA polymerase-3 subunit epsilon
MHKLFFDIETTGADANKDRIIQLAIRVVDEEGNVQVDKAKMYNPGIPISKSATEVHGIKDKDVRDLPSFASDAKKLKRMFEDKIIVTYNGLRFDIPILMNEFERAGVEVELSGKFIDVLKVERKLAPHTLGVVYKKYTGEVLEGAHDALADVNATDVIMQHQKALNQLSDDQLMEMTDTEGMADYSGKLKFDAEGFLVFNFGNKCRGKRVVDEASYAGWVLGQPSFSAQVKKLIRDEQTKGLKPRQEAKPKNEWNTEVHPEGLPKGSKTANTSADVPPHRQGFKPVQTAMDMDDDLPF